MAAENKSNEIKITRVYDAPVKAVWDAWTDPEKVAKWWGPRGFTLTTHSKDLRPGGSWNYTMHGPDGVDWPNSTKYYEVEPMKRLVYDHGANDKQPAMFRVTVLFSESKGKTKMEMTMTLPTPEAADETKKFIKKAGGDATWDRLAEFLADNEGRNRFVINRTFHASLATMYELWSNPKHFSKWLPPTGFRMEAIKSDVKPGGSLFYFMTNDAGVKMYGSVHYKELTPPGRLVYTQDFRDENGGISRHPMAPTWPETMLTTVTLTEEDSEHTRVTIEWEPVGNVTREELETFLTGRSGMTQGWTGSFDKLEEYLEKM